MIVIIRRADLPRHNLSVPGKNVRMYHLGTTSATIHKADLVVFLEDSQVHVLRANDWPFDKPMSAAQLYQYIARHAHEE